ncbi:MAG: hypothetical protein ACYC9L_07535 [Sulfuricaulis sp.]
MKLLLLSVTLYQAFGWAKSQIYLSMGYAKLAATLAAYCRKVVGAYDIQRIDTPLTPVALGTAMAEYDPPVGVCIRTRKCYGLGALVHRNDPRYLANARGA